MRDLHIKIHLGLVLEPPLGPRTKIVSTAAALKLAFRPTDRMGTAWRTGAGIAL